MDTFKQKANKILYYAKVSREKLDAYIKKEGKCDICGVDNDGAALKVNGKVYILCRSHKRKVDFFHSIGAVPDISSDAGVVEMSNVLDTHLRRASVGKDHKTMEVIQMYMAGDREIEISKKFRVSRSRISTIVSSLKRMARKSYYAEILRQEYDH